LDDFCYEPKTGEIRFYITPKYDELTSANVVEKNKWTENRRNAFLGSFRHFLMALAQGRVAQEGFRLYNIAALPWDKKAARRLQDKLPIMIADSLLASAELPNERRLHFKGALEVQYLDGAWKRTSWLTMDKDFVVVNTAGYVNNPYDLIIHGYWSLYRVAQMLPREYVP
jgi:hypothetical protein